MLVRMGYRPWVTVIAAVTIVEAVAGTDFMQKIIREVYICMGIFVVLVAEMMVLIDPFLSF
jgi:hypothetical protein